MRGDPERIRMIVSYNMSTVTTVRFVDIKDKVGMAELWPTGRVRSSSQNCIKAQTTSLTSLRDVKLSLGQKDPAPSNLSFGGPHLAHPKLCSGGNELLGWLT